jgi:CheY-like chemotaxis protein
LRRVLPATIRLDITSDPGIPPALVDATQLQQVVLNLCVNARDAMPGGGVLSVATSAVRVPENGAAAGQGAAGEYVRITVADTGVGMTSEVQARIFEPFFTTKAIGAGTGLGLSMVYGIVAQHNGWLDVASAPGQGATFHVNIPAAGAGREKLVPAPGRPPVQASRVARLVLVVDDEAIVREYAMRLLERAGCRVLGAADGREAIEVVERHAGEIDSALVDLTMPGPPIQEVLLALRAKAPGMQIVVTSGYSLEATRLPDALGLSFLPKPYTPIQLIELLCAEGPGHTA